MKVVDSTYVGTIKNEWSFVRKAQHLQGKKYDLDIEKIQGEV